LPPEVGVAPKAPGAELAAGDSAPVAHAAVVTVGKAPEPSLAVVTVGKAPAPSSTLGDNSHMLAMQAELTKFKEDFMAEMKRPLGPPISPAAAKAQSDQTSTRPPDSEQGNDELSSSSEDDDDDDDTSEGELTNLCLVFRY